MNEANTRMIYANPIVLMICALHQYTYWVEDKMVGYEDDEMTLEKGITMKSTADYICFDVYDGVRLAVVLLEMKVQSSLKAKSIAQVMGCFIRSHSVKPAVCFVLTEQTLNVVLFPFVDPSSPEFCLVNAVWLKLVNYSRNIIGILYLLGVLTHRQFQCILPLDSKLAVYHTGYQYVIKSAYDDRITRLEEELREKDKRMKDIEKQHKAMETDLLKLKAIMNRFTVNIKQCSTNTST